MFKAAGYRIGPGEIENCLVKHPAVANAAVVPARSRARRRGQGLCGAGPGPGGRCGPRGRTAGACARAAGAPRIPKEIEFIDSLPMTTTGRCNAACCACVSRFSPQHRGIGCSGRLRPTGQKVSLVVCATGPVAPWGHRVRADQGRQSPGGGAGRTERDDDAVQVHHAQHLGRRVGDPVRPPIAADLGNPNPVHRKSDSAGVALPVTGVPQLPSFRLSFVPGVGTRRALSTQRSWPLSSRQTRAAFAVFGCAVVGRQLHRHQLAAGRSPSCHSSSKAPVARKPARPAIVGEEPAQIPGSSSVLSRVERRISRRTVAMSSCSGVRFSSRLPRTAICPFGGVIATSADLACSAAAGQLETAVRGDLDGVIALVRRDGHAHLRDGHLGLLGIHLPVHAHQAFAVLRQLAHQLIDAAIGITLWSRLSWVSTVGSTVGSSCARARLARPSASTMHRTTAASAVRVGRRWFISRIDLWLQRPPKRKTEQAHAAAQELTLVAVAPACFGNGAGQSLVARLALRQAGLGHHGQGGLRAASRTARRVASGVQQQGLRRGGGARPARWSGGGAAGRRFCGGLVAGGGSNTMAGAVTAGRGAGGAWTRQRSSRARVAARCRPFVRIRRSCNRASCRGVGLGAGWSSRPRRGAPAPGPDQCGAQQTPDRHGPHRRLRLWAGHPGRGSPGWRSRVWQMAGEGLKRTPHLARLQQRQIGLGDADSSASSRERILRRASMTSGVTTMGTDELAVFPRPRASLPAAPGPGPQQAKEQQIQVMLGREAKPQPPFARRVAQRDASTTRVWLTGCTAASTVSPEAAQVRRRRAGQQFAVRKAAEQRPYASTRRPAAPPGSMTPPGHPGGSRCRAAPGQPPFVAQHLRHPVGLGPRTRRAGRPPRALRPRGHQAHQKARRPDAAQAAGAEFIRHGRRPGWSG